MNGLVYPRLSLPFAKARISEIAEKMSIGGISSVQALAKTDHPHAAAVATGGRVADPDRISNIREAVLNTIEPWWRLGTVPLVKRRPSISRWGARSRNIWT